MTNGSSSIDLFINERYDSLSLKFLFNVTKKASTYIFSAEAHENKVEPIVDKEGRHEEDREEDQLFYPSECSTVSLVSSTQPVTIYFLHISYRSPQNNM